MAGRGAVLQSETDDMRFLAEALEDSDPLLALLESSQEMQEAHMSPATSPLASSSPPSAGALPPLPLRTLSDPRLLHST